MSLNLTYLNIGLGKRNHLRQNVDDMKILHFIPFTAALRNETRVNTQRLFLYPKAWRQQTLWRMCVRKEPWPGSGLPSCTIFAIKSYVVLGCLAFASGDMSSPKSIPLERHMQIWSFFAKSWHLLFLIIIFCKLSKDLQTKLSIPRWFMKCYSHG